MSINNKSHKVEDFYNQEAKNWNQMYGGKYDYYPANQFRLKIIESRLKKLGIHKILDVGCGAGGPMIKLLQKKFDCQGCDFADEMVIEGKKALKECGFNEELISKGNIEDEFTLPEGKFDAILALGVFPHLLEPKKSLTIMRKKLNKNGKVFISFRNDLFSLFTLNKYSNDFFLKKILDIKPMSKKILNEIDSFYSNAFKIEKSSINKENKILYTEIKADFDNPLTIQKNLFQPCGFVIDNLHFYHYHALPPIFEKTNKEEFWKLSMELENPNDWRGHIMASAFVVEASKIDDETN